MRVALIVAHLALAAALDCVGTIDSNHDDWCMQSCNHVPAYCPEAFCACSGDGPTPTPTPDQGGEPGCYSSSIFLSDSLCTTWCHHVPSFCPPAYCYCDATPTPAPPADAVTLERYDDLENGEIAAFDEGNVKIAFARYQDVLVGTVSGVAPGSIVDAPTVCADGFVNAHDIEIDSNGGIFVADIGRGVLDYISPDCGEVINVIPPNHGIAIPTSIEIVDGGLMVSDPPNHRVFMVFLDADMQITEYHDAGLTWAGTDDLEKCQDASGNNGVLFVEHGNQLVFHDIDTGFKTNLVTGADGVVDISDVVYRECCGVYFTANDNNQVWHCQDDPGTSSCLPTSGCQKLCDNQYDSSSCDYLMNPTGMDVDCHCNAYVGNRGNGNFVFYDSEEDDGTLLMNGLYVSDIEVFTPHTCKGDVSASRTPSPTRTPTPSPSSSPSPSPTGSPTPTPFSAAAFIDDYNSVQVAGNDFISLFNLTLVSEFSGAAGVRALAFYHQVSSLATLGVCESVPDTIVGAQQFGVVQCDRFVDADTYVPNTGVENGFSFSVHVQSGDPQVPWLVYPTPTEGETGYNALAVKLHVGVLDCTGTPGQEIVVTWDDPRPCWYEPIRQEGTNNGYTCSPGQPDVAFAETANYPTFPTGVAGQRALYKKVTCPGTI